MIIDPARKLGMVLFPRTASAGTVKLLMANGFTNDLATIAREGIDLDISYHAEHKPLTKEPPEGWTFYTTVRNPFDLLVSWWFHSGQEAGFGIDWIKFKIDADSSRHKEYWPISDRLFGLHHRWTTKLKFETLRDDIARVFGIDEEIPYFNYGRTKRPFQEHLDPVGYRKYYTPELRKYVAERFVNDFEEYGYEF